MIMLNCSVVLRYEDNHYEKSLDAIHEVYIVYIHYTEWMDV